MAVILIAIGLLFTAVDIYGQFGFAYPEFHVAGFVGKFELSPSIRTYTLDNILGSEVQIDYLPDLVGCILVFIGVCMLFRYNRQYWFSIPFILLTAGLSVLLRVIPFYEQGSFLVIWVIVLHFGAAASELLMEYFVLYATVGITDTLVNRSTNTRLLFGWWLTAFCRVFMVFLIFVGHVGVHRVYQVVLILASLFYLYNLIRTKKYVGMCEPVKIGMRRKREKKEKLQA